jgi:hypothetical protein
VQPTAPEGHTGHLRSPDGTLLTVVVRRSIDHTVIPQQYTQECARIS